ncbi:hypothetical protein [Kitasatospora aureofaciens]|uniref:hypothetical protein n=1 Tax=Kitasatospora aureofaciens TaxID=1894 RepID=UPI0033EC224E
MSRACPPRLRSTLGWRELRAHALALDELIGGALHAGQALPGAHCIAAADFQQLTRELVRCAVIADREAGATWATIGEALGLSADAARARCGNVRLLWPPPVGVRVHVPS